MWILATIPSGVEMSSYGAFVIEGSSCVVVTKRWVMKMHSGGAGVGNAGAAAVAGDDGGRARRVSVGHCCGKRGRSSRSAGLMTVWQLLSDDDKLFVDLGSDCYESRVSLNRRPATT